MSAAAKTTVSFGYDGTNGSDGTSQFWLVPPDVYSATFHVYGAAGAGVFAGSNGARGGEATATLVVKPGEVLEINVGGTPREGFSLFTTLESPGGWNGGGAGGGYYSGAGDGGGGGGASDVRRVPYTLSDRLLIGGGGGGGGGSGTNSEEGPAFDLGGAGGNGGSYSGAGGAKGATGGDGQGASLDTVEACCGGGVNGGGGGGGGGFRGGSGGGADGFGGGGAGGNGGLSWGPSGTSFRNGVQGGPGAVIIAYTRNCAHHALCVRTVPGAPTGVAASAGVRKAIVYFATPSKGSPILSYEVTAHPGHAHASGKDSPITVKGLKNGVKYTFSVTAMNERGTGPRSKRSNTVIPAPLPKAPIKVVALAGRGQAVVSFSEPRAPWAPVGFYEVDASPGPAHAFGYSSPITITGLKDGTSYTFTVKAFNLIGGGRRSKPSNAVTPTDVPGTPTELIAIAGDGKATINFATPRSNGLPIETYTITASPGGVTVVSRSAPPITITGLTNGTAYTFTVYATNADGNGPLSKPSAPVTPVAVPGAPTAVTATASQGSGKATVSFTPPASNGSAITSYTVTASPGGKTASGNGSPITVTGLVKGGGPYTFTVRATNGVGTGPPSSPSNPVHT